MNIFDYPGNIDLRHGKRGSGKSTRLIKQVGENARLKPINVLVVTPSFNGIHFLRERIIAELGHDIRSAQKDHFELYNGSVVMLISARSINNSTGRGMRSLKLDQVYVDEIRSLESITLENLFSFIGMNQGERLPDIYGTFTAPSVEKAQLREIGV